MTIIKLSGKEVLKIKGTTDWAAFDALPDEESIEVAKDGPDSTLPSDEELKEFKRGRAKKPAGK